MSKSAGCNAGMLGHGENLQGSVCEAIVCLAGVLEIVAMHRSCLLYVESVLFS